MIYCINNKLCSAVDGMAVGELGLRMPPQWQDSAAGAKPGIGLKGIDQFEEVVHADDPFELEPGTPLMRPDHMRFDPSDDRQAHNEAVAAAQAGLALRHEALGGQVDDVEMDVT